MDQHPGDPAAMHGRTRGLQQVRRWSNWTAAALMAATVVTTGVFRPDKPPGRPGRSGGASGRDGPRPAGNRGGAAAAVCLRPGRHLGGRASRGRPWSGPAERDPVPPSSSPRAGRTKEGDS